MNVVKKERRRGSSVKSNLKQRILLMFLLLLPFTVTFLSCTEKNEIKIEGRKLLYCKSDSTDVVIKRLDKDQEFQGVAIINEWKFFLAYSDSGTEAVTILSTYDLKRQQEHIITEIGGTGESQFEYNHNLGWVVFNWFDGIYVFSLDVVENTTEDTDPMVSFENNLTLIKKCSACFEPRWVSNHIEYLQYHKNGQEIIESVNLLKEILNNEKDR